MLAYTSHGVLVARSDAASARLGHGLSREELGWLRARVLHLMRDRRERRGGSAQPAPPPVLEPELPYAFPLLRPAVGLGIAEAAAWVVLHALARSGARATRRTSRST